MELVSVLAKLGRYDEALVNARGPSDPAADLAATVSGARLAALLQAAVAF
jgi:hypothetical protein